LAKNQIEVGPSENQTNGRGSDGRFVKGNKGGPGNPYVHKLAALKAAFYSVTTPETIKAITQKLIDTALNGEGVASIAASKLLFSYVLSTPDGQKIAEAIADMSKLQAKKDDELEPYLVIDVKE
jgi:hypothetical protein